MRFLFQLSQTKSELFRMIGSTFGSIFTPLRSMRESTGTAAFRYSRRRSTALCVFADPAHFQMQLQGDICIFGGVTSGPSRAIWLKVS